LLAKIANDNAGILIHHRALKFFASKLTPTRHHSSGLQQPSAASIITQQPRTILPITTSQPTATKIHLRCFAGAMVPKCLAST